MIEILPSLTYSSSNDLAARLSLLDGVVNRVHLDFGDGEFVPNQLVNLWEASRLTWPVAYEAHLMVAAGANWAADVIKFPACDGAILHLESADINQHIFQTIRQHHKLAGVALRPETPVDALTTYMNDIDQVTVLLVEPGAYGGQFLPAMVNKITEIRQRWPSVSIEADGGMNPETLPLVIQAGATHISVGSYLKDGDMATKLVELRALAESVEASL